MTKPISQKVSVKELKADAPKLVYLDGSVDAIEIEGPAIVTLAPGFVRYTPKPEEWCDEETRKRAIKARDENRV